MTASPSLARFFAGDELRKDGGKQGPAQVAAPNPPRLNRRMLAVLAGGLATAVLGGTIWSLQSTQRRGAGDQKELFNVDRVSRSEGLDRLPADYSKLPPTLPAAVPQLGAPLPGDLGGPIHKAEQQAQGYDAPQSGRDPAEAERLARLKQAEEAAASSVFFRSGGQKVAAAAPAQVAPAAPVTANAAFDPMAAGPASTAPQSADPTAVQNRQEQKEAFLSKAGSTETRNSGSLQMPASP